MTAGPRFGRSAWWPAASGLAAGEAVSQARGGA